MSGNNKTKETDVSETIRNDAEDITNDTENLVIEAKSSLVILIGSILIMSLFSILLSTWLAKTITNSPSSFGSILGRYFGFDRNETEPNLTWWTPLHIKLTELTSRNRENNHTTTTTEVPVIIKIPYSDYPRFHTIVLPLLFVGAIVFGVVAYYARIKCTDRGFAWRAVPKVPLERVDPHAAEAAVAAVIKAKEADAQPGVDYTIVQGTKEEPIVFALADTLQPLNEEREPGAIVDEGTQYELQDISTVLSHTSSVPDLRANNQTVPLTLNEQHHIIELLQREPLPTITPST